MGRLGLKELRNAANPSRESIADTEIGLYGTATQGEIASARSDPAPVNDPGPLTMDALRAAAREPGREGGMERAGPEPDRALEL